MCVARRLASVFLAVIGHSVLAKAAHYDLGTAGSRFIGAATVVSAQC
jgi:hypothetical protein